MAMTFTAGLCVEYTMASVLHGYQLVSLIALRKYDEKLNILFVPYNNG